MVTITRTIPILALAALAGSISAQIVDPGFESASFPSPIQDPDVVNQLDDGWVRGFPPVEVGTTGGNPGQWLDLTRNNPSGEFIWVANIFTNEKGFTVDQTLNFDYELTTAGAAPNLADNNLTVQLYGTDVSNRAFGTRFEGATLASIGTGNDWDLLADASLDLASVTSGFETGLTSIVSASVLNSYDFLGIRVYALNIADGGGQPGQETLKLDNFTFASIPEPSTYALFAGLIGLGLCILRRRRR